MDPEKELFQAKNESRLRGRFDRSRGPCEEVCPDHELLQATWEIRGVARATEGVA